jgi:hypothetical protein
MSRYHGIGVAVLMAYFRMQGHRLECRRERHLSYQFMKSIRQYRFDESQINHGSVVGMPPMDPIVHFLLLVIAHHDVQAHLMRVHRHLAVVANRPVKSKSACQSPVRGNTERTLSPRAEDPLSDINGRACAIDVASTNTESCLQRKYYGRNVFKVQNDESRKLSFPCFLFQN